MKKLFGKKKSLRPKKSFQKEGSRYSLHKHAKASLGDSGDFEKAVKMPEGEDEKDWLCVHVNLNVFFPILTLQVIDFYNNLNLLVGPLESHLALCKDTMSAGAWEYLWKDDKSSKYKNPTALAPLEFINMTFDFIEDKLQNPKIFPAENGTFPSNFKKVCKDLFKKMFRIYAHLFVEQFRTVEKVGMTAHLNTSFKHFIIFAFNHQMVRRGELAPMADWIKNNLDEKYAKLLKK